MNQDNVAARLKLFLDEQGLSNSQFADQCGIPRPSLSQLLTGRNKKISDVLVGQIHQAFPNLSVMWLLFGEGEMLVNSGIASSLVSDDDIFADDDTDFSENGKEIGLETPFDARQNIGNKSVNTNSGGAVKNFKIEEKSAEPRRVTQITVYYDDSTFETFYPKK